MGERYQPRKLGLEETIRLLVREHAAMTEGLRRAHEAAHNGDFASAGRMLRELDPLFRQHIVDEESQILGLLVRTVGVEGAEKEISVFRQHGPIYSLMLKVSELAAASAVELESKESELEALFSEHALAEESWVFPRAASLGSGGARTRR